MIPRKESARMAVEDELVLIIEAEPETREAAARCLGEMGLECLSAPGADEALKAASGKSISLVVSAIGASAGKEWAMLEELRKDNPDLAAIFIATPEGAEPRLALAPRGRCARWLLPGAPVAARSPEPERVDPRPRGVLPKGERHPTPSEGAEHNAPAEPRSRLSVGNAAALAPEGSRARAGAR